MPPVVAEDPACNVKRGEEAVGHEHRDELQPERQAQRREGHMRSGRKG